MFSLIALTHKAFTGLSLEMESTITRQGLVNFKLIFQI